jgi:hypothetical protein
MMEQGVLGSFIGMLALVLHNFGKASLTEIPNILTAGAAFYAILKKRSVSLHRPCKRDAFHLHLRFPFINVF